MVDTYQLHIKKSIFMQKVVTIVGARPQFVKAAVVSRAFENIGDIQEILVHTGQHYDDNMSKIFFDEMAIRKPDYNLNINGLTHGAMTGQMLEHIEKILLKEHPDIVLVYGDTDSTLAGALAACKLHIKVAHVEAGLRSENMKMPEEINRILTDRVSNILFCPTATAVENLHQEGFKHFNNNIVLCGDVMFDAIKYYLPQARQPKIELPNKYILCTIHRAENTDNQNILSEIFEALTKIASSFSPIVIPLHPRTKAKLQQINFNFSVPNIHFINPVGYFEMLYLINNSLLVMTDSGGLQKESYFLEKKCVTLRHETEWVELVDCKCNILAGTNKENIVHCTEQQLSFIADFSKQLYGDGFAGKHIAQYIKSN